MCKIICITNRRLCRRSFTEQAEHIAESKPDMMILREKDMAEEEFAKLAQNIMEICKKYDIPFSVNSFWKTAAELGIKRVHLPLNILREMTSEDKSKFDMIGTSCHSVEDAAEAEMLNAGYIIAGHIFETDCKKGVAGRGLGFLNDVCKNVSIPVYAIGGITAENANDCIKAGAKGVCIMSGFMINDNVTEYMNKIRGEMNG